MAVGTGAVDVGVETTGDGNTGGSRVVVAVGVGVTVSRTVSLATGVGVRPVSSSIGTGVAVSWVFNMQAQERKAVTEARRTRCSTPRRIFPKDSLPLEVGINDPSQRLGVYSSIGPSLR